MTAFRHMTGALVAAFSLNAMAAQTPDDGAPSVTPLVQQCEKQGQWKDFPAQDLSALTQMGQTICTDQPFNETLTQPADRKQAFRQMQDAQDELGRRLQKGHPLESGELPGGVYVMRKPYTNDPAYIFQLSAKNGHLISGLILVPQPAKKLASTAGLH